MVVIGRVECIDKGPCIVESHQPSLPSIDSGDEGTFSNLQGPLCVHDERPLFPKYLQGSSDFRPCGSRHKFVVGRSFDEAHEVGDGRREVGFVIREDDSGGAFVNEWGGEEGRDCAGEGSVCLARSLSSASTRLSSRSSCSKILRTSSSCLSASSSLCTYSSKSSLASFITISSSAVQGSTSLSSETLDSVEGVVWVDSSTMVG